MSWKLESVVQRGSDFFVKMKNDEDPENVETREYVWGYDPSKGQSLSAFRDMLKRELKLMLKQLNEQEKSEDITELFR
jgi:hypothetical protein